MVGLKDVELEFRTDLIRQKKDGFQLLEKHTNNYMKIEVPGCDIPPPLKIMYVMEFFLLG